MGKAIVVFQMADLYREEGTGMILVDGLQAIEKYGVSNRDHVLMHPQPPAYRAYAHEIVNAIRAAGGF